LLVAEASSGKSSVILTDKDDYWINVSDDLYFSRMGAVFVVERTERLPAFVFVRFEREGVGQ